MKDTTGQLLTVGQRVAVTCFAEIQIATLLRIVPRYDYWFQHRVANGENPDPEFTYHVQVEDTGQIRKVNYAKNILGL